MEILKRKKKKTKWDNVWWKESIILIWNLKNMFIADRMAENWGRIERNETRSEEKKWIYKQ